MKQVSLFSDPAGDPCLELGPTGTRTLPERLAEKPARFDGSDYSPRHDRARLTGQILRVYETMLDGRWRTLDELAHATGDPHASISAQLRHLRKERFGGYRVDKRARGDRGHGLFEYRLAAFR